MTFFHDSTLSYDLDPLVYLYFIICIFMGQTLDAIDGKHARNTKRGSPLGQLMDHGVDSLTNSCHLIYVCQTLKLGNSAFIVIFVQISLHVSVSLPFLHY